MHILTTLLQMNSHLEKARKLSYFEVYFLFSCYVGYMTREESYYCRRWNTVTLELIFTPSSQSF